MYITWSHASEIVLNEKQKRIEFRMCWQLLIAWYAFINVQAPEYRDNKIHTGWLDSRIAMRVRAERPPWEISVVGGALYVSCFQGLLYSVSVSIKTNISNNV
jgi:hypothetical protein